MSLIEPPPTLQPHFADVVVPGGPVYRLPWWWPFPLRPVPKPEPIPAPTPTPTPTPTPSLSPVVDAHNVERVKSGLAPLLVDQKLVDMAQYWATRMARTGEMNHFGFAQRMNAVYPNVWAGENIAEGQTTVADVMNSWMNSPGHRANILNPRFTAAGAGMLAASDGTQFWCVDFKG